jgi:hypothetical protein
LQWQDDSLFVYFARQKNDQQGKWAAFCRHLFCNPLNKYVFTVFVLSLWIASNEEILMLGGPLFLGSKQPIRFNKLCPSFFNEHAHLVYACGYDPDLVGVHSFRKGGLCTFLFSGSTAGPTSGAIHQRAGWFQDKVNDTYILFEGAGDHFIGLILASLNIHQHLFSVFPPRFGIRGAADGVNLFLICCLFLFYMLYYVF